MLNKKAEEMMFSLQVLKKKTNHQKTTNQQNFVNILCRYINHAIIKCSCCFILVLLMLFQKSR